MRAFNKMQKPAHLPFTDRQFIAIVVPMFVERLLQMVVGVADTFVISYAGEAAVSGVSLVNQFNNIFIFLSTALAAGGAVITSQYIGSGDKERAGESASQLFMACTIFSVVLSAIVMVFRAGMLRTLFGAVDDNVMSAALTYLSISVLSFPVIAIYDAGSALYRSMGKTRVTMYVSIIYNLINVVGNVIGVFVLKAGVAGVAWPTVISRAFGAVAITILCFSRKNDVTYHSRYIFNVNPAMLKKVLYVAVPNGCENGVFQLVKVALSSIVSLFGTSQIAANGIAQNFWSLANAFGNAGGPGFSTVIGQCMGDDNTEAAEYYFHRFDKILILYGGIWNLALVVLSPFILKAYAITDETRQLTFFLIVLHNLFCFWLFPYWGASANGLRAAGDVKFTMIVSVLSTVFVRLVLSYVFGITLSWGVTGVLFAMIVDWMVRSVAIVARIRGGKWKKNRLI